jgi:hypothetical protein
VRGRGKGQEARRLGLDDVQKALIREYRAAAAASRVEPIAFHSSATPLDGPLRVRLMELAPLTIFALPAR